MLLSGFGAGFALFKAFPPGEESKVAWAAVAAAGIVSGIFFLIAGITGNVWLFGI
jgi:hypothetical protein